MPPPDTAWSATQSIWPKLQLPVGSAGHKASGWVGMKMVIVTEGALFLFLLFCYYYYDIQLGAAWRPKLPDIHLALPNTILLLASSIAVGIGERGARRGAPVQLLGGLGVGFVMGAAFIAIQILEWLAKPFRPGTNLYGSLYFTITGFHMAHVVIGLLGLAATFLWGAFGYFDGRRHAAVMVGAAYWHFVDAVWLAVFFTYYVTPRLWW